jgi:O-antigen/teichoic acid export membrane protein
MTDGNQAIRDVVKGASIVYIGLLLELLIAFVAQIIAARYLSVGDFGGLTAGTALLDIGSIVAGLGFSAGLTRYLPRVTEDQKRTLAAMTLGVTFVTSIALGGAVTLAAPFLASTVFGSPAVTPSIRIFGAAIPLGALLKVAVGGIRGQELSLARVVVKNIVHPTTRILLVVLAVSYGLGQAGIAGAYAFPYMLSAFLALVLFYRSLPASHLRFDRGMLSDVTRYSLPLTVGRVSDFVYRSIDIFLILYFLGDNATGIYGVAYAAVSFMGMFSTAFNYLSTPIASKLESTDDIDQVLRLFRSTARWLTIGSVCVLVPLAVFATDFVTTIYGSKYQNGGIVLAILAVGFAAKNVLSIHNPMLEALGRSKTLSINSAIAAVSNVALNLLLIPQYGIVGAAIATNFSFLLRDGFAAIQVYRSLGATPVTWEVGRPTLLAVPFLSVVTFFVAPAVPATLLWLIAVTGISSTVYLAVVLLAFGLSSTDVMIIRSAQERFGLQWDGLDEAIKYLDREQEME